MPTRNCETRPVTWKIHRNKALANAVIELGKHYKDIKKGFTIWPMWIGFVTHRDNLGFFDGAPGYLRDSFFPRHPEVTVEEVEVMRDILHEKGLIILYEVEGLKYVLVPKVSNWNKLIGNVSDKTDFPLPSEEDIQAWEQRFNDVYTPLIRRSNDEDTQSGRRSNGVLPESKSKSKSESKRSTTAGTYSAKIQEFFDNPDPQWLAEIKKAYPAIDLEGEFKKMRAWLVSNPDKSKKHFKRFAANWLANAKPAAPPAQSGRSAVQVTEDYLHQKLGRIATPDMVKAVMREINPKMWWKVSDFIRRRYPKDPGSVFSKVERELMEELEQGREFAGMAKSLAGAKSV